MMVSLDIYRPAAQEQLRSLGEQNNILTLPIIEGQQPTDICQRAISAAILTVLRLFYLILQEELKLTYK